MSMTNDDVAAAVAHNRKTIVLTTMLEDRISAIVALAGWLPAQMKDEADAAIASLRAVSKQLDDHLRGSFPDRFHIRPVDSMFYAVEQMEERCCRYQAKISELKRRIVALTEENVDKSLAAIDAKPARRSVADFFADELKGNGNHV
jgi:hypothetical protein